MTDETNDTDETEARLRAALAARADSVEPGPADAAAALAAGAAARRRRTWLSVAAVVALLAAVAGAALLLGDDGEDEVASGPETTTTATTTTAPVEGSGAPAIWPLPSMSVQYESPEDAAEVFMAEYVGITADCQVFSTADTNSSAVGGTATLPCGLGDDCDSAVSCAASTSVDVERHELGWVVLGAEANGFDVTTPQAGAVVGANIVVDVAGLEGTGVAELRPLGEPAGSAPTVDTNTVPLSEDGSWHLILGAADGQVVAIVTDGLSATARVITVDGTAVPIETTTTTTGPTDDGVQGWPGTTARVFDDPGSAASAFMAEVLQFPAPVMLPGDNPTGPDITFPFRPRETAGIETLVTVHDTGTTRGWVVTVVSSDQGTIDSVARDGDDVTITGSATAFEAHVNVRLYDLQGNVLGEATTLAGANGEIGPFEATVHQDVAADGPVFVQIAEGDASGEGAFVWATWAEVPAG